MTRRHTYAGLIPVGFQTITLANSTALGFNSTLRNCSVIELSIETNQARYRADGTAPTKTTGVLCDTGGPYFFEGYNGTSNWKWQRTTGTCKISCMGFKVPGDKNRG